MATLCCIKLDTATDPCAGSGHILDYLFDILMQIYTDYSYTTSEAVRSIVENNLYGLDIDERAAQLAYFSVMMKARSYDRRFLTRKDEDGNLDIPQPHVYAIVESNHLNQLDIEYFTNNDPKLKKDFGVLVDELHDAKEYGSILNVSQVDFAALYARMHEVRSDISMYKESTLKTILPLIQVAEALAQKYHVAITNPPYMGGRNMNAKLLDYICKHYADGKADIFSTFIIRISDMTQSHMFSAMITQHSWMFLSSFEALRKTTAGKTVLNMAHLGPRAFEEISGEVVQTTTWTSRKAYIPGYKAKFVRLISFDSQVKKENAFLQKNAPQYNVSYEQFMDIPGIAFGYWLGNPKAFVEGKLMEQVANPRQGLKTLDNDYYIHFWYEIDSTKMNVTASSAEAALDSKCKWFPINHGGEYRKYYGNNYTVVNWFNDGEEMKANAIRKYNSITRTITNIAYYFREGITWSVLCSQPSFRWYGNGFIFSNGGQCVVPDGDVSLYYLVGLLNSKVTGYLLNILSPTLGFESGY